MAVLRSLNQVGPRIASNLFARKRPRLRPIYDSMVTAVTGTHERQWEPLRHVFRANNRELHTRLLRLHAAAGLTEQISPLRAFDMTTCLEGKDQTTRLTRLGNHQH